MIKLDFKENEKVIGIFTEFLSSLGLYVTDVKGCTRDIQREWNDFIDNKFEGRINSEQQALLDFIANRQGVPFDKDAQHRDILEPDTTCRDIKE